MPLADVTNQEEAPAGAAAAGPRKTVEQTYQKKSQLEHILLRPDTYIGSSERNTEKMWVLNEETMKMEQRELSYVPGLYKIFDEILVNAADNKQRDPSMNLLQVEINQEENKITVWNNGKGVPVQIHQEHGLHVPELIFGHLLTSSNYDDMERKTTGGRNGFGAKLTNIFSTEFAVRTYDSNSGKLFSKVWRDSMRASSKASIQTQKGHDFTEVTFKPDLTKFGMERLEDDIVALMKKRVWDMAGCTDKTVKVKLNGKLIPVADFKEYVNLYPIGEALRNQQFESTSRWTVCVAVSPSGFRHCSFVNSIWTFKGGKHLEYITNQVVDRVTDRLKKKNKDLKSHIIKQHLWVFVNCLIENPAFDSQTKETLTTVKSKFGSECKLSDKFLDAVCKGDLMLRVVESYNSKIDSKLNRSVKTKRSNRVTGIAKLEEANEAGGAQSQLCTLVLTEGDSAKTLAISGFSIVGRDYWGVFPLRGKLLNVREAPSTTILRNAEIQNIMKILSLQIGEKYQDTRKLRYGHVMIMADQDHDGSHIKGLLVNFIHHFWPELLSNCPGFLVQFITPIVKVTRKDVVKSFYSIPEYRQWQEACANAREFTAKYYKGLGTSTPAEAKEYFQQLARHRIEFDYRGEEDKDAILLAFDKNRIEDRKAWVTGYREENVQPHGPRVTVADFINKELVLFSRADCERSIPGVMDGFKPSLRKILFCCFKKPGMTKKEIKVAQLSGYVSEHSAYHHGETSLQGAIIGMAQDFCGSNNMNLLEPIGQFGTRISGGKDASQARYLFTKLSPLARALFPADDDALLTYREDDGLSVEPHWYVPIIPMVLANGCKGIGTGYSTSIPMHNPEDLVAWIRCKLAGQALPPLRPWYRDFTNNDGIVPATGASEGRSYRCFGTIREVGQLGTVVNITELPVEKWTEDYKTYLEELLKEDLICDFREHHTDVTVDFEVQLDPESLGEWRAFGLLEKFKLRTHIPVSNLVCFDHRGNIAKYDSVTDIFEEFFQVRLEFYRKRKDWLMDQLKAECEKLKNMVRFILEVVNKELVVMQRKRGDILADLRKRGYKAFPPEQKKTVAKGAKDYDAEMEEGEEEGAEGTGGDADYNYLLGMKIWALTHERIEHLKKLLAEKQELFNVLYRTPPEAMWLKDLEKLVTIYKDVEAKRRHLLDTHLRKGKPGDAAKAKKKTSSRLEESKFVPKRSETAKKLAEEQLAKLSKAEACMKKKEEREMKRLLQGDKEESAPKRRKKDSPGTGPDGPPGSQDVPEGGLQRTLTAYFAAGAAAAPMSEGEGEGGAAPPPPPAAPRPASIFQRKGKERVGEPAAAPPPRPKPAARKPSLRDTEELIESSSGGEPSPKPQRAVRARKPVKYALDDHSLVDEDSDSDGPAPPPPQRKTSAAKPRKAASSDDEDDSFQF